MEELKIILQQSINIDFLAATLSNPRTKDGATKVKVRPIMKQGVLLFQFEAHQKNQVFHENLKDSEAVEKILEYMVQFKQMQMETKAFRYTVLVSKKGKLTIQKKKQAGCVKEADLSHNRSKKYILQEDVAVPFLQDLGVMTEEGKIVRTKFDKFRQINRFLEFIEDVLPQLAKDREVTILDFGCGYGPIGIYIKSSCECNVDMIDVNERALNLAIKNAERVCYRRFLDMHHFAAFYCA